MSRLHEFSTHLLAITEFKTLLEEVLDTTIALQDANFGNIQLYNPKTRALEVVVQRGFQPDLLEHFRPVHDGTACARAMKFRERVVIEDVDTDPEFAPYRCIAAMGGFRQFNPRLYSAEAVRCWAYYPRTFESPTVLPRATCGSQTCMPRTRLTLLNGNNSKEPGGRSKKH
jgi:hypothetical protein